MDPLVGQNEKVAKDEQDHPSRLTKINEEKTTMDPLVGQNEKVTKDEEDRPPRLAESLLRESQILSIGSPVVYKLSAELKLRREKGKIIKKSIGSPSDLEGRTTEKVLMVVGATGAGKTTLINGMANYILGINWEDKFRYKLIVKDSKVSQTRNQTKEITAYTFHPMKGSAIPYTFTVIDTPGFEVTEGLERVKEITDQIEEFFSVPPPDGIDHIDGIGIVTQASLARLTPTQEYIFTSILSMFGKDVAENIFILITFADGQTPPVMEAIKKAKIPAQKFHKFNNSAIFADNTETAQKKEDEEDDDFDKMFWKMGARSFKKFFRDFEKSRSVSLQLTQEVLKEREQLQNKKVHSNVLSMVFKAQQSLRRLDEIALRPNPLTKTEYLELLIESEKNEAKQGWKGRVQYYEEAKRQAEILSKAKDPKAAEKLIKEEASKGDKWYSRYVYWRS